MPSSSSLQEFKARFFRALAHPVRIGILEVLAKGDRSVQELQHTLGLEQPVVSQQLAVLRNQGVEPSPSTPEELRSFMKKELDTWGRVVKEAKIPPQ